MIGIKKIDPTLDTTKVLDAIEKAVHTVVKPYGFRKHGRTLHRFVSGDISQVINFQLGQAYLSRRQPRRNIIMNMSAIFALALVKLKVKKYPAITFASLWTASRRTSFVRFRRW